MGSCVDEEKAGECASPRALKLQNQGICAVWLTNSLLTSMGALTFPVSGTEQSAYLMSRRVPGVLLLHCCIPRATVVMCAARSSVAGCPAQYVSLCFR